MTLCNPIQNDWRIIKPTGTTNYVLNPSAETTGNFAAQGSATVTRSTTYQKYGLYSYRIQTTGHGQGLSLTTGTLTNSVHWFTARIRWVDAPLELRFNIGNSSQKPVLLEKIDETWDLYGVMFGATESNGRTSATITQFGAGAAEFYVDGIQIEPLADWSTYCDGTQEGCTWNGAEHAATSTRSALSSDGGQPKDLYLEYKFFVQRIIGAGASDQDLVVDSYALLPGGELNNIKVKSRQMTIIGKFIGDNKEQLHLARKELIKLLKNNSSIKLQYNGAKAQKEIKVSYQGGLEGEMAAFYRNFEAEGDADWVETFKYTEKASIQFLAPDPYWYEVGESAALLDTNDSATFRTVAARLKSTGQWSALGPPNAAGTYDGVYVFAEDATYIYIGGDFANWDNIANADNIVRYNKQTGAYSAMGVGLNGIVHAIVIAPNGDVYIGGQFTNAGGVAAADYLTRWDGSAYNAVGTPVSGAASITSVQGLAISPANGYLYIGGTFSNWANIANADNIVYWNGSSYNALSTGANDTVIALAFNLDGSLLYVGGVFLNIGGVAANRIASWNGSAFSALSTGLNGDVEFIVLNKNNIVFVTGTFTTAGGVTVNYIAQWNGVSWGALSSGLNDTGYYLSIGPDDALYISGTFTAAGGLTLTERAARWNGYSFAHLDLDLPGTPNVYAIHASKYPDSIIKQKYDIWLGFSVTGTATFAGKISPNNEGSVLAFPRIVYERSGGTSATIETLRNETSGKELLMNYSLLDSERLTIDLNPLKRTIISNFFGSRPDAVLVNSDFGSWVLQPDTQDITSFVATTGSPTITAYLLWKDRYDSYD